MASIRMINAANFQSKTLSPVKVKTFYYKIESQNGVKIWRKLNHILLFKAVLSAFSKKFSIILV